MNTLRQRLKAINMKEPPILPELWSGLIHKRFMEERPWQSFEGWIEEEKQIDEEIK